MISPLILLSQDIDKEFLDSLPGETKDELMERIESKESTKKPVYRKASTFIDKDTIDKDTKYNVFGSKFFDTIQTSFMPTNEPNLDSSYILDFGDILEIQLIGQKDSINTYEIERDGSIKLPDIGKLTLSGLS